MQCGFKAIRREAFKKILPHLKDNEFFFDTELIILCETLGFKVKEIAVKWEEEKNSKVKVIKTSFLFLKNAILLRQRISSVKNSNH